MYGNSATTAFSCTGIVNCCKLETGSGFRAVALGCLLVRLREVALQSIPKLLLSSKGTKSMLANSSGESSVLSTTNCPLFLKPDIAIRLFCCSKKLERLLKFIGELTSSIFAPVTVQSTANPRTVNGKIAMILAVALSPW